MATHSPTEEVERYWRAFRGLWHRKKKRRDAATAEMLNFAFNARDPWVRRDARDYFREVIGVTIGPAQGVESQLRLS